MRRFVSLLATRVSRAVVLTAALVVIAMSGSPLRGQGSTPPILLVTNDTATAPFGSYLAEVLRAEGITSFATVPLASVDAATLSAARLVVLAETPLTDVQAALFSTYHAAGGRLVAMRPDARIASLFGITPAAGTTANGYLLINQSGPGAGLQDVTLPIKGATTHYDLAGAATAATLYADRVTPTARPAVVTFVRSAAWAFDLGRSVAYTRQGDPALAGQERDGIAPIRTNDVFFGAIDLQRVNLPHADVQMRLFRRVLTSLLADVQPLPRLWYFPGTAKTLLTLTGDSHTSTLAPHTALLAAATARGGRVSLYLSRWLGIPAATVAQWRADGHEVGLHPYFSPDNASMAQGYQTTIDWFGTAGWGAPSPTTRHHSLEWQGWTDPVSVMAAAGMRMDTSYYAWGPALYNPTQQSQAHGYITGSGLPMKFVSSTGALLPVYQQTTVLTDEQLIAGSFAEGLTPSAAIAVSRQLIDASQAGTYSTITTQFHVDYYAWGEVQPWVDGTMDYAQGLGIPMWTDSRWLAFTEARAATALANLTWSTSARQLGASVTVPAGAEAQTVLVPATVGTDAVTSVTLDGQVVTTTPMTINGEAVRAVIVAPAPGGAARALVVFYGAAQPAPPAIAITDATVTEGDAGPTPVSLTLSLSRAAASAVTVDYTTANGTATAGADYVAAAGTLTVPAGATSITLPLQVTGDTAIEPNETFVVNLSNAVGADIADSQGLVTIRDDDTPPSITINDVTVTEGNSGTTPATFTLSLSQPSTKTITVTASTAGGTATAGTDFQSTSAVVVFAPGVTAQPFTVPVTGDTAVESNETFFVTLTAPANATLARTTATGTIVNDDSAAGPVSATFQVTAGADDVTEEAGSLTADGSTLWVGTGSSAATSFTGFRFTGVTVPAGATITGAHLELNAASTQWLAMAFEFAAEASANSQAFSAGSRPSQRTLLAPRVSHTSDNQWVAGTWYALNDLTPIVQAVVNQPGWAPGNALALVLRGTGQAWARKFASAFEANPALAPRLVVTYNAAPAGPPSVSLAGVSVTEGSSGTTAAILTATLSAAITQTVTVSYATGDGTATAPADYAAASGVITFAPGQTQQTIAVTIVGDTLIEANETFTATLSGPVNATLGTAQAVVTIVDDDSLPTLSINDVSVNEGNAGVTAAAFTVSLSAPSVNPVAVTVATGDVTATAGSDYSVASSTVTIPAGSTSQTFTVNVLGDTAIEPTETFTVTLSAPVNATLARAQGVGTIVNDDVPGGPVTATFTLASGADDVNEEAGTLAATNSSVWMGNGSSPTTSYAGLRFAGVALPAGAVITSARLEVNAAATQWMSLSFEFGAEAAASSEAFSQASRPSQRVLLAPRVAHASNAQWLSGSWYALDDISTLVKAVVDQPGWAPGNALSLVLRGTGQAWARKFANAYELNAAQAPRLVVTYTTP